MDGTCRTSGHTLLAEATLVEVDVADIALDLDSLELTLLLALATTDTGCLTSLHGNWALVLVDTGDEHSPTLRALLAQFNDVTRTSLDTGTASNTLLFIDFRKACFRIHTDGIELTSSHTVATTQTAKAAGRLASTTRIHSGTGAQTAVLGNLGAKCTGTITTYHSYLRFTIGSFHRPRRRGFHDLRGQHLDRQKDRRADRRSFQALRR